MRIRLSELVERLGGTLAGDSSIEIIGVAPLDIAGADQLSFLTNPKLREQACHSEAAALILSPADDEVVAKTYRGARIVTGNPYAYFARSAQWFSEADAIRMPTGIHPQAFVDPAARVAPGASIGPMCVVEAGAEIGEGAVIGAGSFIGRDAFVGSGTLFHPHVTFQAGCRIGMRGIVHSGAVIGTDGFGFANENGAWIKIPQRGNVAIGDDVEIGANTTIDRGALADTIVEDGVKLDNQIQIGHNCRIGAHTAMAGCVGVAGSVTIGKYCTIGGAAMIAGHLVIADRVHIAGGTLVSRSLAGPGQYAGSYPIAKKSDWERNAAILRNLDTMREKIRALEKKIKTLTDRHQDE